MIHESGDALYFKSIASFVFFYVIEKDKGDKNVYFIGGEDLFAGECWDSCTVDGTHPNDLGFYRMAMRIEKTLKIILAQHNFDSGNKQRSLDK